MSVVTFHFYKELAHLVMLPAVVLIKDFSQGIFSYHHVEISRAQFLPQMQNNRKSLKRSGSTQQIYICKQSGQQVCAKSVFNFAEVYNAATRVSFQMRMRTFIYG